MSPCKMCCRRTEAAARVEVVGVGYHIDRLRLVCCRDTRGLRIARCNLSAASARDKQLGEQRVLQKVADLPIDSRSHFGSPSHPMVNY
eukprot:SAG11_NODE_13326_length_660_cov_0.736185_1_plen_88_part_00